MRRKVFFCIAMGALCGAIAFTAKTGLWFVFFALLPIYAMCFLAAAVEQDRDSQRKKIIDEFLNHEKDSN